MATAGTVLRRYLPIASWLETYQRKWLRGDLIGALTAWAIVVPESVAYAHIERDRQDGGRRAGEPRRA